MTSAKRDGELLGYKEAAELLDVKAKTLYEYRARGILPEPDLVISGNPVWKRSTLTRWDAARKTRNAANRHKPIDWSSVGF